jgi:translation initiation factor IF-2
MNISTLAKVLGKSVSELRKEGARMSMRSFSGRNTRIPYNDALEITKLLRPDKLEKLKDDDKLYAPQFLTVHELAELLDKPPGIVMKSLIMNGVMATLNETIDFDTASLISSELGYEIFPENGELYTKDSVNETNLNDKIFSNTAGKTRPPIVTVMGHVDHGKTTLLDTIRHANVAAGEAGAITQHIASYQIEHNGHKITFVDTPGHAAFTAMRARGTQLADFIILVVSTTEGPKPQTIEVIDRAKISKTPIIVALNKIDLPESDVEKTKNDLTAFGLVPEEWGGDTPFIPISAKNGTNIETILETILVMAEVKELTDTGSDKTQAIVLESNVDKFLGAVATVLVLSGEIHKGDIYSVEGQYGKIRKLMSSEGAEIDSADICYPAQITGLENTASIGSIIEIYDTIKDASLASGVFISQQNKKQNNKPRENLDSDIKLILKADVQGSLEALKETIIKIPQEMSRTVFLAESVGELTQSDLDYANTAGANILAFHTVISPKLKEKADELGVTIISSDVIYVILEWIEEQILARITHETRIDVLGRATVLALFTSTKSSIQIFGGEVISGKILSGKAIRIVRPDNTISKYEIVDLQKNKETVKEINISQQFGISVTGNGKINKGDIIECIDEIVVK